MATVCSTVVIATAGVIAWKFYFRRVFFARFTSNTLVPEGNRRMGPRKRRFFAEMERMKSERGDDGDGGRFVLIDVGSGSGANFQFYPPDTQVICIDPNDHFESYLRAGCADWPPGVAVVGFHVASCEKMDQVIEAEVADAVVVAGLLCTVDDVDLCLRQILRVLKPGGKLFFLEHVISPPTFPLIRLLQRLLNPLWRFIMDGCNINRQTELNIRSAAFSRVEAETFEAFELENPTWLFIGIKLCRTRLWGIATK